MARNDIEMRITADSRGVAAGMAPAIKALDETSKAAQQTEHALDSISTDPIKLNLNDEAVQNARKEIDRLRTLMHSQLKADVNADTSQAQRRIRELQRTIRVLETDRPKVVVDVETNVSALAGLKTALTDLGSSGMGALGGTRALQVGLTALGTEATAATAGVAAVAIGIGAVGFKSGMAAADVETLTVQLNSLTEGRGPETLKFLQAWAKSTPFELDQATAATKRLVAAGVPLQDIPDYLNDIGNATAALDPTQLAEVATVFSQMEGKGKILAEEMQQLAERGIPAWQTLADAMGLSVAEVQKMATKGQLGADKIELLRTALGKKFPTAMNDAMDTLNGKLSSLHDTVTQTWQELGSLSLPAMKGAADAFQGVADIIQDFVRIYVWGAQQVEKLPFVEGLEQGWKNLMWTIGKTADGVDWLADKVTGTDDDVAKLGDTGTKTMKAIEDSTGDAAASFDKLQKAAEDAVKAAIDAFKGVGGGVRAKVSFIISSDDLQEEIHKAIAGTPKSKTEAGVPAVTLPATLSVKGIAGLDDKQQDLVSSISDFVQQGLDEGARRAEIVPGFDEDAWYRNVRKQTRGLLIDAGLDPKGINKVLDSVFGLPRTVPVDADISGAKQDLADLSKPIIVPVVPTSASLADFGKGAGGVGGVTVSVSPAVPPGAADTANTVLDGVAQPGGQDRQATIDVIVDPATLTLVKNTFRDLLKPETKTITIQTQYSAPSLNVPGGASGLVGGGNANPSSARTGGGTSTRVAPRQTPVKVYVDGAEVASRVEARSNRMFTQTSVRRSA